MTQLKYRFLGKFENLKVIGLKMIQDQGKQPKVQILCATEIAWGSGKSTKIKSAEFAIEAEAIWKTKVTPEIWKELKAKGLAKGAIIDVYAAIDNWGKDSQGGTWFQIIKLLRVNYQPSDYSLLSDSIGDDDSLDSLESEINDELGEFDAA